MFELNKTIIDNKLCLAFTGRVDTNNAKEVEDKCMAEISASGCEEFFIDAANLEYISSAGLRVILKFIKMNPNLSLINVQPEVYDVFEMTGFTEMCDIKKAYRQFDITGCKVIGEGAKGIVYRYDDETIIKVYKNDDCLPEIERERELAKRAFVSGIPTAISYDIVKVGERFGSVFELLDSKSLSELISENPDKIDDYAHIFANLAKTIHSSVPNHGGLPNIKERLQGWTKIVKDYMKEDTYNKVCALFEGIEDKNTLIHGDYHTKNIMMQNGEALLIDMDTLCVGNPVIELGIIGFSYGLYNELNKENANNFLQISYEAASRIWKVFLNDYFETSDETKLQEYRNKIDLITCVRIINHVSKRNKNPEYLEYASNKLDELVKIVDTLNL